MQDILIIVGLGCVLAWALRRWTWDAPCAPRPERTLTPTPRPTYQTLVGLGDGYGSAPWATYTNPHRQSGALYWSYQREPRDNARPESGYTLSVIPLHPYHDKYGTLVPDEQAAYERERPRRPKYLHNPAFVRQSNRDSDRRRFEPRREARRNSPRTH